jgi:hypothetical protein
LGYAHTATEYGITIDQKNKAAATDWQQNKPGEYPYCNEKKIT